MLIAILGNGPSINKVNWDEELKDKDIIVRMHHGGFQEIYNKQYFKKEHHLILSGYFKNSDTLDLSKEQQNYIKNYKKIKFVYLASNINTLKLINRFGNDSVIHLFNNTFSSYIDKTMKLYKGKPFSTGVMAILYYIFYYPDSKLFLYGFDLAPSSGYFWNKHHKHSDSHDFEKEKLFLNTFSNKYEFRS